MSKRIVVPAGTQFYGGILEGKGRKFKFVPLITHGGPWECEHLDIRFLIRQDQFARMAPDVGDLDARIDGLFDALRIPQQGSELHIEKPKIEDPCFCLLEDDALVPRITAETLHLLNDPRDNDPSPDNPEQDHVVHVLVTLKRREKEFSLFGG